MKWKFPLGCLTPPSSVFFGTIPLFVYQIFSEHRELDELSPSHR